MGNQDHRTVSVRPARCPRWRSERGQTFTEYMMISGILTAIVLAVTNIVVPTLGWMVVSLAKHMALSMSSVTHY